MDIAEVDFNRREANCAKGIRDCDTRMRIGSRIDDNGIRPVTRIVNLVDQNTLMVALLNPYFAANPLTFLHDELIKLIKRDGAVDIRFTRA
jgi:hypothetical protein